MSDRKIVSDHLLVRWIERVEGLDMNMIHAAMIRDGLSPDNDGDVLWFVDTYLGLDMEPLRWRVHRLVAPAARMGARRIKHNGFVIQLRNGAAITVMKAGRRSARALT